MNKKILIGVILAVTILIGVSFTSVVGYQSIEYDVKASPLFNIRSSRAIDEESGDFSCEYVGKGEECCLSIPRQGYKNILIKEFIDRVYHLNDEEFDKFKNSFIARLCQELKKEKIAVNKFVTKINQLEVNSEKYNNYSFYGKLDPPHLTLFGPFFLGCEIPIVLFLFLVSIYLIFVDSIYALIEWINNIRHSISYIIPGCCETWN